MITITYACDGCRTKLTHSQTTAPVAVVVDSKRVNRHTLVECAPAGWVAFDPYTNACYCLECWVEIRRAIAAEAQPS